MSLLLALVSGGADTTPPVVTFVSQTRTRISRVPGVGVDASDVVFSADEAFTAYEVYRVASGTAARGTGTLLESGGGASAGQQVTITITDDELVAAGGVEGSNTLKIFTRDAAGNWST